MKKIEGHIEGDHLVLRVPLKRESHLSSTGRTIIVASEGPKATTATVDGRQVSVRVVAWIPKPAAPE